MTRFDFAAPPVTTTQQTGLDLGNPGTSSALTRWEGSPAGSPTQSGLGLSGRNPAPPATSRSAPVIDAEWRSLPQGTGSEVIEPRPVGGIGSSNSGGGRQSDPVRDYSGPSKSPQRRAAQKGGGNLTGPAVGVGVGEAVSNYGQNKSIPRAVFGGAGAAAGAAIGGAAGATIGGAAGTAVLGPGVGTSAGAGVGGTIGAGMGQQLGGGIGDALGQAIDDLLGNGETPPAGQDARPENQHPDASSPLTTGGGVSGKAYVADFTVSYKKPATDTEPERSYTRDHYGSCKSGGRPGPVSYFKSEGNNRDIIKVRTGGGTEHTVIQGYSGYSITGFSASLIECPNGVPEPLPEPTSTKPITAPLGDTFNPLPELPRVGAPSPLGNNAPGQPNPDTSPKPTGAPLPDGFPLSEPSPFGNHPSGDLAPDTSPFPESGGNGGGNGGSGDEPPPQDCDVCGILDQILAKVDSLCSEFEIQIDNSIALEECEENQDVESTILPQSPYTKSSSGLSFLGLSESIRLNTEVLGYIWESVKCGGEVSPSIPEVFVAKAPRIKPQMQIQYKVSDSPGHSSRWHITVPHFDYSKREGFSPKAYQKGNYLCVLDMLDGTSIRANCISPSEGESVIAYLASFVEDGFRTPITEMKHVHIPNRGLRTVTVEPCYLKYFEGSLESAPTWTKRLKSE